MLHSASKSRFTPVWLWLAILTVAEMQKWDKDGNVHAKWYEELDNAANL